MYINSRSPPYFEHHPLFTTSTASVRDYFRRRFNQVYDRVEDFLVSLCSQKARQMAKL